MATEYRLEIDDELHQRVFSVLQSYGLAPVQAINLFLNQIAVTKSIAPLITDGGEEVVKMPNSVTLMAIKEAEMGDLKTYGSFRDLMRDIDFSNE